MRKKVHFLKACILEVMKEDLFREIDIARVWLRIIT